MNARLSPRERLREREITEVAGFPALRGKSSQNIKDAAVLRDKTKMNLLIVEDNNRLRSALKTGFAKLPDVNVIGDCATGETAVTLALDGQPDVILMDVQLETEQNGIQTAVAIRRERPRQPVVFNSIQDDDRYFRDFRHAGILSHYAYVRKSNYLLPELLLPLLRDAVSGRSFIDPDIEIRVNEVRVQDANDPLALLEPNEKVVAEMIANGLTNAQIAQTLGFKDKRTISRVNGAIYTVWGLKATAADEKTARTRAALIVKTGRMLQWNAAGQMEALNANGDWEDFAF